AAASTFPTLTGGRGPGVRPGVSACAAPRREESLALLPGLASGPFSWMRHDAVAPCLDTPGTVDYTWQRMLTRLAGRARRASGGRGGPEGAHIFFAIGDRYTLSEPAINVFALTPPRIRTDRPADGPVGLGRSPKRRDSR